MSGGTSPNVGQNCEEDEHRKECPTVRRPREESDEHSGSNGDEDGEEEGVMKPAKRLRVYDTKLDEQAQREVYEEQYRGGVEGYSRSHRWRIPSRGAALTTFVPRSRSKKVLAGYGRRGGDAKMHPSREQTGEEVRGLDGERP